MGRDFFPSCFTFRIPRGPKIFCPVPHLELLFDNPPTVLALLFPFICRRGTVPLWRRTPFLRLNTQLLFVFVPCITPPPFPPYREGPFSSSASPGSLDPLGDPLFSTTDNCRGWYDPGFVQRHDALNLAQNLVLCLPFPHTRSLFPSFPHNWLMVVW